MDRRNADADIYMSGCAKDRTILCNFGTQSGLHKRVETSLSLLLFVADNICCQPISVWVGLSILAFPRLMSGDVDVGSNSPDDLLFFRSHRAIIFLFLSLAPLFPSPLNWLLFSVRCSDISWKVRHRTSLLGINFM